MQARMLHRDRRGLVVKVHSHVRFIRRKLLRKLSSPCNCTKWVHNPLLIFSVHAKVDQIASVNVPG